MACLCYILVHLFFTCFFFHFSAVFTWLISLSLSFSLIIIKTALEEKVQEADGLAARTQELETQLSREEEDCKRCL